MVAVTVRARRALLLLVPVLVALSCSAVAAARAAVPVDRDAAAPTVLEPTSAPATERVLSASVAPYASPRLAKACEELRAKTTPESGAAHLRKIALLPDEEYSVELEAFFGCLVPLVGGVRSQWTAVVAGSAPERCAQLAGVLDKFNEERLRKEEMPPASMFMYWHTTARERGPNPARVVRVTSRLEQACRPSLVMSYDRDSDKAAPGTAFKVTLSTDLNLPVAHRHYLHESHKISARPFCFGSGLLVDDRHLTHWLGQPLHKINPAKPEVAIELARNKYASRLDPLHCKLSEFSQAYCVDGKDTTCMLRLAVTKSVVGKPIMVQDESVGPCPFEWVDKTTDGAAPHFHLRVRPGKNYDIAPCKK